MADLRFELRDIASTLDATNKYRGEVIADRRRAIRAARAAGLTWPTIAADLGLTVRAAMKSAHTSR